MNSRVLVVALFLLVSGICALIFQTAWLREFRLIFGASTPASAAVLAIFMGGLGLGNAVLGRRVDASPNPLRLYAMFELGISAACVASPFLIVLVRSVYFSLGGQDTLGITGATIVRLLLSTLVIGVPTFLMGGTLPAAARAATAAGDRARGSVGWLYGLNTLGAVIGTLASTFVLLEMLGNRATLFAAAAVNIINALLAYRLAREYRVAKLAEGDDAPEPAPLPTKTPESAPRRKARRQAPRRARHQPRIAPARRRTRAGPRLATLCRRCPGWLRLPAHGDRLVPHARPHPRRHDLHLRHHPGRGLGGNRRRRRALPAALSHTRSHAPRSGPDVRLGSIVHRRAAGAGRPTRAARCRASRAGAFRLQRASNGLGDSRDDRHPSRGHHQRPPVSAAHRPARTGPARPRTAGGTGDRLEHAGGDGRLAGRRLRPAAAADGAGRLADGGGAARGAVAGGAGDEREDRTQLARIGPPAGESPYSRGCV